MKFLYDIPNNICLYWVAVLSIDAIVKKLATKGYFKPNTDYSPNVYDWLGLNKMFAIMYSLFLLFQFSIDIIPSKTYKIITKENSKYIVFGEEERLVRFHTD